MVGEIADKRPEIYKVIDAVGATTDNSGKGHAIYMAVRLIEIKTLHHRPYHTSPTWGHGQRRQSTTTLWRL